MAIITALDNPIGQVRLLIGDQTEPALFTDDELSFFLDQAQGNIYYAAFGAYGNILRNRALLAKKVKREGFESERYAISEIRAAMITLTDQANAIAGVQTGNIQSTDEIFEHWRPLWRDYTTREFL